jgi:hypothetical protein
MDMNMHRKGWLAVGLFATGSIVGCGTGDGSVGFVPSQPSTAPGAITFRPEADAGVPVVPGDPATLIVARTFSPRANPFALRPAERTFEQNQLADNLVQIGGGWRFDYEPQPERQPTFIDEPQPYRRLAGVLIGESVTALIDMGDGQGIRSIRPGQRIEGTEWTVVSIDEEKAVLRRVPRPGVNVRPNEVIVRLEPVPFGGAPAPGQQPGGQQPGGRQNLGGSDTAG